MIQQNASAAEEMSSTTEELTAQSDQLLGALGFFRTENAATAAPPRAAASAGRSLSRLQEAVTRSSTPAAPAKRTVKAGVALRMRESGDSMDKDFERY